MNKITVKELEDIHNHFRKLMQEGCFQTANNYIKDICLTQDKNIWMTCLVLLKGLKEREEFKDTYQDLIKKLPNVV